MKRVLTAILMSVVVLLAVSSCASVPTGPLEPGELRLLSLDVPDNAMLKMNVPYRISIPFQADGKPQIRRVCYTWSGDGPYCVGGKDVKYGSDGTYIEAPIYARADVNRLECYVEYVREGKVRRTNTVASYVTGIM